MTEGMDALTQQAIEEIAQFREAEHLRYAAHTMMNCLRSLRHIARETGSLHREDIMQWLRSMKTAGMTNQTLNHYIRHANMLLKHRHEKPIEYVKAYKHFTHRALTEEEIRRVLKAASLARYTAARDNAIVRILFCTGIRLGELTGMKMSDIRGDVITVTGKGQKTREVLFPAEAKEALDRYLAVRQPSDPNYVWTTPKGRVDYNYMRRVIYHISRRAGVRFHAHAARHHYATSLRIAGVSLESIRLLMGHESMDTTKDYFDTDQIYAVSEVRKVKPKFFLSAVDGGFEPSGADTPGFERDALAGI